MKPVKKAITLFFLLAVSVLYVSCEEEIVHKGKTPLLSVGNEFLYHEDVQRFYSQSHGNVDSATFVNDFIERWAEEAFFYHLAKRNVRKSDEIELLVENYKRSLILNIYETGLVEEQLEREISKEEVDTFYKENISMFLAKEPMVKGLLLKVPKNTPRLSLLRGWCKERTVDNLEKLDKYSLTNDVEYEYFLEIWKELSSVAEKTPLAVEELQQRLLRNKDTEFKDGDFVYFVSVDSIVKKGDAEPVELVEPEIRLLLSNTKKAHFIKEKKRELYKEALETGAIKYYNK